MPPNHRFSLKWPRCRGRTGGGGGGGGGGQGGSTDALTKHQTSTETVAVKTTTCCLSPWPRPLRDLGHVRQHKHTDTNIWTDRRQHTAGSVAGKPTSHQHLREQTSQQRTDAHVWRDPVLPVGMKENVSENQQKKSTSMIIYGDICINICTVYIYTYMLYV